MQWSEDGRAVIPDAGEDTVAFDRDRMLKTEDARNAVVGHLPGGMHQASFGAVEADLDGLHLSSVGG